MAVGDEAQVGVRSYAAIGREATLGTYASATSAVAFQSCTFRTTFETMKLDQIATGQRGYARRVQMGKNVGGTLEQYVHPQESVLLIANALQGALVSTALTSASDHSIAAGNLNTSTAIIGLSANLRKGDTLTFRYLGGRVNTMRMSAEIGQPVKVSYDMVFIDSTQLTDDISAILSISSILPLTYVDGAFRYSSTEALAATTTAAERIQGFELVVNNNIKSDKDARELGRVTPRVLPSGRRDIEFKIFQRWDTTTTFNRMVQATAGSVDLLFVGQSLTAEFSYQMTVRMPNVRYNEADPAIGRPDEVLSMEIPMDVLIDSPGTSTGREIGFTIRNNVTAY